MAIEDEVISRIMPAPEWRRSIEARVQKLVQEVITQGERRRGDLQVMLVGSVAKDTFLHDPDVDVFVLFPTNVSRRELERLGLEIGREVLESGEERYAEHPYIHGIWQGLEVDLVPCYRVDDPAEMKCAVDRTPFHTRFIRANLSEEQRTEVRLLKQFMKGVGTYGAEARVQGFSGYLIELLVLRYGTFRGVLEAATHWRPGEVLTLKGKGRKFAEPMTFYDPVDESRNVASALSLDSLALFMFAAQMYLRDPSIKFFFPDRREPLTVEDIRQRVRERGTDIVVVSLDRPEITDDNLYPQVRRTLEGVVNLLASSGFTVMEKSFHAAERLDFVLELETATLPSAVRHDGPPAWIENSWSFLQKWKGQGLSEPYLENGRWMVMVRRDHQKATDLIANKMSSTALGSDLRGLKGLRVQTGEEALSEDNRAALSILLDKRKNWEV